MSMARFKRNDKITVAKRDATVGRPRGAHYSEIYVRVAFRVPAVIMAAFHKDADKDYRSINQQIVVALRHWLEGRGTDIPTYEQAARILGLEDPPDTTEAEPRHQTNPGV